LTLYHNPHFVDDKTEREVDYKKVIVTEVDEDLRFYAQFVDNGMLSFKSFFFVYGQTLFNKKSLKIPKGLSESIYRRTDNIMAKRKRTKEQLSFFFFFFFLITDFIAYSISEKCNGPDWIRSRIRYSVVSQCNTS
jgi:hypothetical protein